MFSWQVPLILRQSLPADSWGNHGFSLALRILPARSTVTRVTLSVTHHCSLPLGSNPLSLVRAGGNDDVKPLDLFAAGGEAHFQLKPIVVCGIRFRPIERDQGGKFSGQALLDIGCFECRATHGDGAVFGRNGKADRGQRAGRAIGAHAGIPTRTSRQGVALTSRSSDVVCAPATLAVHSTAAAMAQHDVLICLCATFLHELDVSPSLARRPQTACFMVTFTDPRQRSGSHTDLTIAA